MINNKLINKFIFISMFFCLLGVYKLEAGRIKKILKLSDEIRDHVELDEPFKLLKQKALQNASRNARWKYVKVKNISVEDMREQQRLIREIADEYSDRILKNASEMPIPYDAKMNMIRHLHAKQKTKYFFRQKRKWINENDLLESLEHRDMNDPIILKLKKAIEEDNKKMQIAAEKAKKLEAILGVD